MHPPNAMTYSITGIFADAKSAAIAVRTLRTIGFRHGEVTVLGAGSRGRRAWIANLIGGTGRAMLLGAGFGAIGGSLAGFLFVGAAVGTVATALLAGTAAAAGGLLLGLLIGRSTISQIRAELESEVAAGRLLVSVDGRPEDARRLTELLRPEGATGFTSTAIGVRAAILGNKPN
jgi:hypothetical protein